MDNLDRTPQAPPTALKQVLVSEGRRHDWLAAQTGINPSEITRIVNGMDPRYERARNIAAALGRSCTELGWPHYETGEVAA